MFWCSLLRRTVEINLLRSNFSCSPWYNDFALIFELKSWFVTHYSLWRHMTTELCQHWFMLWLVAWQHYTKLWLVFLGIPWCEFNPLVPGGSGFNFKNTIFNLVLLIGISRSYHNVFRWMSWDLTNDKSTLVQVMAWCRQATSHYLIWTDLDPDLCCHMAFRGHNELDWL